MDFGNAALLVAAVFGIVELAKKMIPDRYLTSRVTVIVVVVASFLAVFLMGATVWAHTQVVGDSTLDKLGVADKIVVSLFLAGATVFARNGLQAVANIGENQQTRAPMQPSRYEPPDPPPPLPYSDAP